MYQKHQIHFWWEIAELPPEKEKITKQTHKKTHTRMRFQLRKIKSPHLDFLEQNQAATAKNHQAPPGGGKIFFPRKQHFLRQCCPWSHIFYMGKAESRALVKSVGLIKRWILGIRWAGMSGPSTAQSSCYGRSLCQASPSQGWLCQPGFQRDGNRFSSYPRFIPVHLPVPFQGSLIV